VQCLMLRDSILHSDACPALQCAPIGCMLLQPYIKFRTSPQEHEFGRPYQLGHLDSADKPSAAMLASVRLAVGDIIIVASDGLWDNIFDREVASIAIRHLQASSTPNPSALVRELASTAYTLSQDRNAFTPYSYAASEWFDMVYNGGKQDDISIVAAFVER
jgi:protein phosphatase PTC7